jgi:3-deoxy-D-manno-octulosonic-acid transferase
VPKAKLWLEGRAEQVSLWEHLATKKEQRIWFHCASLGEFEQGRPVLEQLRKEYPEHKIVLTFFSPSGYSIRKNTLLADYVFYLPLDHPITSKKFIAAIKPSMAFFVKYEFWYFYGRELFKRKIPFFCISAIFRPSQIFFKPLVGVFFRKMLLKYTQIFVQDQDSLKLLYKQRITNVTVAGDTRYDSVYQNFTKSEAILEVEKFCGIDRIMVCGSTWPEDEKVLLPLIQSTEGKIRFIIAPHEISTAHLEQLKNSISRSSIFYSEWVKNPAEKFDVLIIDNVGMLSRLYKYGHFAYIGGGFGAGIHNILEAAVYGVPVFFGPHYKKFREANELIASKGAFPVENADHLLAMFATLLEETSLYNSIIEKNRKFVFERIGTTELIMKYLRMNNPA